MDKIGIYSPTQVAIASFVGGPFATVYVLWKNFHSLGSDGAAKQTIIWGIVFIVAVLVALPILPDSFPNYAIPIAYAIGARFFAEKHQMTKQAIVESDRYGFHSGWNVAGVSISCLIAFMVVGIGWILALDNFGIVKL